MQHNRTTQKRALFWTRYTAFRSPVCTALNAMTEPAQILVALAEISTGLAGFSGVVVVLAKDESWSIQEQLSIWALLQASLGAIVLSLLPLLMSEFLSNQILAWRISIAILATFHIAIFVADMYRTFVVTGVVPPMLMFIPGIIISLATTGFLGSLALGYFPELMYPGYLLGIVWLLCVAIIWFVSVIRIIVARGT